MRPDLAMTSALLTGLLSVGSLAACRANADAQGDDATGTTGPAEDSAASDDADDGGNASVGWTDAGGSSTTDDGGNDGGGNDDGGNTTSEITHVGTVETYDPDGQGVTVPVPPGTMAGDLMVLFMHRTDDDLPLAFGGWTRVAECYKRDNGYDCSTEADCTVWATPEICETFGGNDGAAGHDLAQAVFVRPASASEPADYSFDLNADSSGHPGWAILTTLRGADSTDPVRAWSHEGCDGDPNSVFPSVLGEAGDMVLLSQSFDDAIGQDAFLPPTGTQSFGYVSDSDEAGFLFGGLLTAAGDTGPMETLGDGGPPCKDALISLTIAPAP